MKKSEKHEMVGWLKEQLEEAPSAVIADYRGLSVAQITDLRNRCREGGVLIKVVKNTLLSIAVDGTTKEGLRDFLEGPTALAWHESDPGAPAKILKDFASEKGNEDLEIKGGVASGKVLSAEEVKSVLATMPSREELLAQMAQMMNSGPQRLYNVISAGPNNLGRLLGALEAKKKEAA